MAKAKKFYTQKKTNIILVDYGYKRNIVRELTNRGAKVFFVSRYSNISEMLKLKPQGIVLSNGPGNPADFFREVMILKELITYKKPILGICLGHQLLALATGAKTYKMKFGHRGINHPVWDYRNKRGLITSHNHGYTVGEKSVLKQWEISFRNMNDGVVEGLRHKFLPMLTVQFHPEASPGPWDASYIFDDFFKYL